MQKIFYNTNLQSLRASNVKIDIFATYESIVLDNVSINGITNFGLEIKNNSDTGNVTNVLLYGSPNGVDYFPIEDNLFLGNIGPRGLQHKEFGAVTGFLRIAVETDINMNIDVYLHGNIT